MHDPIALVALYLAVILVSAKLGGDLAVRAGQPAVLGELIVGVLLGNASLAGFHGLEAIKADATIDMLARLGVLILLFEVGLESTVPQMLKVGGTALAVAVLGVVSPFVLGWGVGAWLLPDGSAYQHAFLGATLCATSVGITARVLQDLGRSQTIEARIILGAAVIDDVLALVVLAVVSGLVVAADAGGTMGGGAIAAIVAKALVFLVGSLAIGVAVAPKLFQMASRLRGRGALLATGLVLCFLLAWLAGAIGLAPIVGAFAAGLILEHVHYREFEGRGEHGLEDLVHPISGFLVPIFFVLMGMQTDLTSFVQPGVLALAAALTAAGVIGKQTCALGVWREGVSRMAIGIGMVPRGEVGLIFANIGLALTLGGQALISPSIYSAVVVMVIVTTMMTPPALKWAMGKAPKAEG
jgi:Kef-type K+ transport system membrane component KefB